MKRIRNLAMNKYIIFFILIFAGCTSTPKATQYPTRYIDQPYTLQKNVDTWSTIAFGGFSFKKHESNQLYLPIPIPLFWEHSINDNLTLEIPIIPMALKWKIHSDEFHELGIQLGWGYNYSTVNGSNFLPSVSAFYKKFIDTDHAFILSPEFVYSYFEDSILKNYLNFDLSLGYLIQVNEKNAIEPKVILAIYGKNKKTYLPLELFYSYRLSPTWQLESSYRLTQLGLSDYQSHMFLLSFKKFY